MIKIQKYLSFELPCQCQRYTAALTPPHSNCNSMCFFKRPYMLPCHCPCHLRHQAKSYIRQHRSSRTSQGWDGWDTPVLITGDRYAQPQNGAHQYVTPSLYRESNNNVSTLLAKCPVDLDWCAFAMYHIRELKLVQSLISRYLHLVPLSRFDSWKHYSSGTTRVRRRSDCQSNVCASLL